MCVPGVCVCSIFSLDDQSQLNKMAHLRKLVVDKMNDKGHTVIDIDRNVDGNIEQSELVKYFEELLSNEHPTTVEIQALVRDADVSNDGLLQYDEFNAYFHQACDDEALVGPGGGGLAAVEQLEGVFDNEPLMVKAKQHALDATVAEQAGHLPEASR